MSFNYKILVIGLICFSCGVKSPPAPPKDTILPSIDKIYLDKLKKKQKSKQAKEGS